MTSPAPASPPEPARLQPGDAFPAFSLPDAQGQRHSLGDYAGKYVVLYVYPKDDTPGCTREACDFRDHQPLREQGAVILGISRDDAGSHQRFAAKYNLPFTLLSDPDATFLKQLGSFGPRTLYGKTSEGVKRQTFLIGPDGRLVKAWLSVKVEGHADAVSAAIAADRTRR